MKVADSSHYLEKFNEVLEVVEKECIEKNANFVEVLNSRVFWNAKYLQKVFGYVADISLKDYVRRRRLTEAFYKINDFSNQKMSHTVNGIVGAKRKIIREFGENPVKLQPYLYEEVSEEIIKERLEWKLDNGLLRRKEISGESIVLFSPTAKCQKYDLDKTYFVCRGNYFWFKGSYIGKTHIKDNWLSALLHKDVYIAVSCYESVNRVVEDIYHAMKGAFIKIKKPMKLCLTAHLDKSIVFKSLVTNVRMKDEAIIDVEVDELLKVAGDELRLDISRLIKVDKN